MSLVRFNGMHPGNSGAIFQHALLFTALAAWQIYRISSSNFQGLIMTQVTADRIERFLAYRSTLTKREQHELDCLVDYVCEKLRQPGCQFGKYMAIELVMALIEIPNKYAPIIIT